MKEKKINILVRSVLQREQMEANVLQRGKPTPPKRKGRAAARSSPNGCLSRLSLGIIHRILSGTANQDKATFFNSCIW